MERGRKLSERSPSLLLASHTRADRHFVPPAERIATFDNDGTLWVEHPMYVQMAFILDRVKALSPLHPEWKDTQPFKAALEGDMKTLAEYGEQGLWNWSWRPMPGCRRTNFSTIVKDWLATARDPRFKRPYTELGHTSR